MMCAYWPYLAPSLDEKNKCSDGLNPHLKLSRSWTQTHRCVMCFLVCGSHVILFPIFDIYVAKIHGCQHVLEDLEVQNSIAMPHLKSWKTSGLQKIGRVPNHVRSHKWDSWDHVCETLCVHKCVIQVAKAALLWTRLYKNSGSQRSIKSLQSGQSLRCSALHIGKKSLQRIVAKTGGRRKWIHNETPARRS